MVRSAYGSRQGGRLVDAKEGVTYHFYRVRSACVAWGEYFFSRLSGLVARYQGSNFCDLQGSGRARNVFVPGAREAAYLALPLICEWGASTSGLKGVYATISARTSRYYRVSRPTIRRYGVSSRRLGS